MANPYDLEFIISPHAQQTTMVRGAYEFNQVAQRFASQGKDHIDFLLVGLGSYAIHKPDRKKSTPREYIDMESTYQIFTLISQLENQGLDYNPTGFDINERAIELLKTIEHISVIKGAYHAEEVCFFDYVANCRIEEESYGLRYDKENTFFVYYADVPPSFRKKRDDGELTTIVDSVDVSHDELTNAFDLVVCTNVLDYLPPNKQVYSLLNLKRYMKDDGFLIMNGMEDVFGIEYSDEYSPVIEGFGLGNISKQFKPRPEYLILEKE